MTTGRPAQIGGTGGKRRREPTCEQELPDAPGRKAAKIDHFEDIQSTREQARPYRLLTARMPTRALTSQWSLGQNRRVDLRHVQRLCGIFANGGLKRRAKENYLLVLCSKAEVSNMQAHGRQDDSSDEAKQISDFTD